MMVLNVVKIPRQKQPALGFIPYIYREFLLAIMLNNNTFFMSLPVT